MKYKFCQSFGMPLSEDVLGTNADGTQVEEYCKYCFKDGAFIDDYTMEEMAEFCSQFVSDYNHKTGLRLNRRQFKEFLMQFYPTLKRWNT